MPEAERRKALYDYSLQHIVGDQRKDMDTFGVQFDTWFLESSLYQNGEVMAAIETLRERGHTYESEGALWFRATAFGDDQDHVLIRHDGRPGYLAADIAYHHNKFERGFDWLIDIWGPDHHGHITRTKAGVEAVGCDVRRFEILVHQFVRLFRGTEMVRMSKRAGDIIPLRALIEDVGTDAARFFFLMQSMDSHLDFDLELAKKQAAENPVYYVQYAHARICSILRGAEEKNVPTAGPGDREPGASRRAGRADSDAQAGRPAGRNRAGRGALRAAPDDPLRAGAGGRLPRFYTNCRVLSDDAELTAARLALVMATRTVLQIALVDHGCLGAGANVAVGGPGTRERPSFEMRDSFRRE